MVSVAKKGSLLIGATFAVNTLLTYGLWQNVKLYEVLADRYSQNLRLAAEYLRLESNIITGVLFFGQSREVRTEQNYRHSLQDLTKNLDELEKYNQKLDAFDPIYSAGSRDNAKVISLGRAFAQEAYSILQAGDFEHTNINLFLRKYALRISNRFQTSSKRLSTINKSIVIRGAETTAMSKRLSDLFLYAVLLNLMLSALTAVIIATGIVRRLKIVDKNTREIAAGKLGSNTVAGQDEIAILDATIKQMSISLLELRNRQNQLWKQTDAVLISTNAQGKITSISPNLQRVFGVEESKIMGSSLERLISDPKVLPKPASGSNVFIQKSIDLELFGKQCAISVATSKDGLSLTIHDISTSEANRKIGQLMIAMISHDMRSPLSAIRNSVQLIEQSTQSTEIVNHLAITEHHCDFLIELVSNYLDLDRFDYQMLGVNTEFVSLQDMVEAVINALSEKIKNRGIKISHQIRDQPLAGNQEFYELALVLIIDCFIDIVCSTSSISESAISIKNLRDCGLIIELYKSETDQPTPKEIQADSRYLLANEILKKQNALVTVTPEIPSSVIKFLVQMPLYVESQA